MDKSVQLKYQFRKYLKAFYDDLIKQKQADPKSVKLELGKLQRFRNIVNQTDPEELFAPFKDEELEGFISGKKKFSSKSPDRRVFERVRVVMEGDLHHAMEIDRNIDAVPDEWDVDADDARLRKYHGTLKQAKMQIGSAAANLPEFRKIDHDPQGADNTPENRARSAHPDGTKNTRFKYEETDPVKRAAETIMYNESSDYRIREIENDPERLSNKVFEQANVDDIAQGGKGFERRTLRNTTVTPFRTQQGLETFGSQRLQQMVLKPGLQRAQAAIEGQPDPFRNPTVEQQAANRGVTTPSQVRRMTPGRLGAARALGRGKLGARGGAGGLGTVDSGSNPQIQEGSVFELDDPLDNVIESTGAVKENPYTITGRGI